MITHELRGPRRRLIETLQANGIRDLAVLRAFDEVPRHLFVPTGVRHRAYEDAALPIGSGQTISQPSIHALYLDVLGLTGRERVLEIGTGSGFQTALLARLAAQVFTIERVAALMDRAKEVLRSLQVNNVSFLVGDGTIGWREYGPYDAILVGAGSPTVPQPLVDQLAIGGRLLCPVGNRDKQEVVLVARDVSGVRTSVVTDARFVPLVGTHGWVDGTPA
ncbi:MAG: protein-L-isoaspartate(D-aspartate) O-methyltransferase [Gemmatimonadaceae bacterium]|nr:protein-L-isoaspartate(D-aspartate) O-methyltransferase [Gemmatimonadaceae bacterium]